MKNILFLVLIISCSAQKTQSAEKLEVQDRKLLEALHEEPMRMGTKKVIKEGMMTTEIWTYSDQHGSRGGVVETLLYKNGELVSHTISDSSDDHTFSRQFRNKKVIEATILKDGSSKTYYFDEDEKIRARISQDGEESECYVYEKGNNPQLADVERCERDFNTAP